MTRPSPPRSDPATELPGRRIRPAALSRGEDPAAAPSPPAQRWVAGATSSAQGASRRRAALGLLRRHWLALVGGASLIGIVVAVDPIQLGSTLEGVRLPSLALMAPVALASYAARGLGWHALLRRLDIRVSRRHAVQVELAGQAFIFLPAGDLGRVALLRETLPGAANAGEIAASVVVQELVFMTLLGLAAIPAALDHPELIGPAVILVGLLTAIVGILLSQRPFQRLLGALERVPVIRRHAGAIRGLHSGVGRLAQPSALLMSAGWNALGAVLGLLLFALAMDTVGITGVAPAEIAFMYALGHLLSAASMLPGGLGSYEGIITGLMVLEGVSAYAGAAAALLHRGFTDLFMAGVGLLVGAWLRRSAGRRRAARRGAGAGGDGA